MTRKLLFVLFSDRVCTLNHAFLYALDLTARGHEVAVLLEGEAIAAAVAMDDGASRFSGLFRAAVAKGIVRGACRTAAGGCARAAVSSVADAITARGLPLLADLDGHAGIGAYVDEGFEIVPF